MSLNIKELMMNAATTSFIVLCRQGNLSGCKYLLDDRRNINLNAWDDLAFRIACNNDQWHIAKWLLSIPENNICVNFKNYNALQGMHRRIYLNMTKMLLRVSNIAVQLPQMPMSLKEQILFCGADLDNVVDLELKSVLRVEMQNIMLRYLPSMVPDLAVIIASYL